MIPVSDLIALFARMYREHWAYEWGAAREGCVDCSGAFVWAYRQLGHSIYHGSNTIARRHVGPMTQMPAPGYAAFKWRKKDTSKFPDGRGDYYHIGLVDETGEWVYEARSARAGFTRSSVSVWHSFAPLLAVDYGDEGGTEMESEIQYEGVVVTKSGGLNLRSGPGTGYPIIRVLPKGTLVGVMMEPLEGWLFVRTGENTGYVSAKYIAVPLAPHPETEAESAQDTSAPNGADPACGGIGVEDPDQYAPDAPDGEIPAPAICTRLRRSDGVEIDLAGLWEIVTKPPDEGGGD